MKHEYIVKRFKYWICKRDLELIAHGNMDFVKFYSRKPSHCDDAFCDENELLEVYINITNPNSDGKNKGSRKKLVGNPKKRQGTPKKVS